MRREEKFTDQKSLNISSLQTDYLNIDSISDFGRNSEIVHAVQTKCKFCGVTNHSAEKCFKRIRKEKKTFCAVDVSDNRRTERTPQKCFRCGSEDHMIAKCPKPPKDIEELQKQVPFNEKGNCACDNSKNNSDQNIYASMACISSNDECSSENYGDSSQFTDSILDYGATCHMTTEVSGFITGSLEDTDKYIEAADGHHVTVKQKGKVQIKMCDDHGDPFITMLHNVLLVPHI